PPLIHSSTLDVLFLFATKNTPLDNHIQRGKTSQLFYKHRDFVLNIASFLQTSRLYFKPTYLTYNVELNATFKLCTTTCTCVTSTNFCYMSFTTYWTTISNFRTN